MHFDIIHEITCGCNCLSILIVLVEKAPGCWLNYFIFGDTPCLMKFVGCTTSFSYWLKPPTSHLSQSHSMREVEKASLMDAQRRLKECIKKTQAVGSLACFLWRCSGHLQPQGMTKTGCNGIQLKLEMRTAPKNRHAPDGHLENEVDNGMAEPSAPLGPNDNLVHPPWSFMADPK